MAKAKKKDEQSLTIAAPNMELATFRIRGTVPYMQNKFSKDARKTMKEAQEAGSQKKKGGKRDPKDFDRCFKGAQRVSEEGWNGISTNAFRAACIAACRTADYKMTHAKLVVQVIPDGFDADDGTPLVKITKGKPEYSEMLVKNSSGVADIRARPLWRAGWEATVSIEYDADMFQLQDVANLLMRAGRQVGIGEGRPGSPKSAGIGYGLFELVAA